ncbi:MAG: prolipoprotein diacylglyceryl transferase [Elusimicrobiota bacterium]|nr:prolipoprotein diacylglyceryl transferase [Elusimicrobiota bacterium]
MFPTLLTLGPFSLSTYGALSAAGYGAAIWWLSRRREAMGLSEDKFWSVVYWLFGGILLGAKLTYVLVERDLTLLWRDPRFGFVFYGGVAGAFVAGLIVARREKLDFRVCGDFFGAALPLGHAIGRLGCLAAGCCYGAHTDGWWGLPMAGDPSRHPVQLYEAAANLVLFAFAARELGRRKPGTVLRGVVAAYALIRFALEFLRDDPRGAGLAGLSPSQVAAVVALLLAWRLK